MQLSIMSMASIGPGEYWSDTYTLHIDGESAKPLIFVMVVMRNTQENNCICEKNEKRVSKHK